MPPHRNTGADEHAFRFPSHPNSAKPARHALRDLLLQFNVPRDAADEIETAAGEAIANAIEHGYRPETCFTLHVKSDANSIEVEIEDEGTGFEPPSAPFTGPLRSRGFGIAIMRALADEVTFERDGRCVRLRKDLPHHHWHAGGTGSYSATIRRHSSGTGTELAVP